MTSERDQVVSDILKRAKHGAYATRVKPRLHPTQKPPVRHGDDRRRVPKIGNIYTLESYERVVSDLNKKRYGKAREDFPTFVTTVGKDPRGKRLIWGSLEDRAWRHVCECEADGVPWILLIPWKHCKSTVFVVMRSLYIIGNDPQTRIKIISSGEDKASERLMLCERFIEHDPDWARTYGRKRNDDGMSVRPDKTADWSATKACVTGRGFSTDPTLAAYGVHSKGLGGDCDAMFIDDCVAQSERFSRAERMKTTHTVREQWLSRITLAEESAKIIGFVGTPWASDDCVAEMAKNPEFRCLEIACDRDYTHYKVKCEGKKDGTLPIDGFRTQAIVQKYARTLGPTTAKLGLRMDVSSLEGKPINPEFFHKFKRTEEDFSRLDLRIALDPNTGENPAGEKKGMPNFAAIIIGGRNSKTKSAMYPYGTIDILHVWLNRELSPHETMVKYVTMARDWKIPQGVVEENTAKNLIKPVIERAMLPDWRFTVSTIYQIGRSNHKVPRILRLDGPIRNGEIRFAEEIWDECGEYIAQWDDFPGEYDDGPDVTEILVSFIERTAYDTEVWMPEGQDALPFGGATRTPDGMLLAQIEMPY